MCATVQSSLQNCVVQQYIQSDSPGGSTAVNRVVQQYSHRPRATLDANSLRQPDDVRLPIFLDEQLIVT